MPRSSQITDAGNIANLTPAAAGTISIFTALNPKLGAPSTAAILGVPGTGRLRRRLFRIEASGVLVVAADTTLTVAVQAGTDTNPANNTTLATSAAVATTAANGTAGFSTKLELFYDWLPNVPGSGRLTGTQEHLINGTIGAKAALTAGLTGLNDLNEPVFNLVCGISLSAPNAGTYAVLDTFALEA